MHCSGSRPSANVRQACGIEVDEEDPLAEVGQRQPDGLGRRGLGDAALLVGDREDPRHGRGVYEWPFRAPGPADRRCDGGP